MVLLSAQGMDVAMIAQVRFTSPDRVRDVLHNFNTDGFDSLQPRYGGGRPPKFDLEQREQIKKVDGESLSLRWVVLAHMTSERPDTPATRTSFASKSTA
jgi:transposase